MRSELVLFPGEVLALKDRIANFLLANSNIVRFTRIEWRFFGFRRHADDIKFAQIIDNLSRDFKERVITNMKFNDIVQGSWFEHYFYRLSTRIRELFRKDSLLYDSWASNSFFGFEDPTFFKNNAMIGSVITHEPMVILYVTDSERKMLLQ